MTIRPKSEFYQSPLFYTLLVSPLILLGGLVMFQKKREALLHDAAYQRSSRATKMAQKRLSEAKKMLDERKNDRFYEEIFKALYGYTSDKLSIDVADLTKDILHDKLKNKQVPDTLINRLITTIDVCEMARFASMAQSESPEKIYSESVSVITELETLLNK